jgi:hypothetical protein
MEIRRRVGSGIRTIALLVVSITITATILAAMVIDTLATTSVSASHPLRCSKTIHPEVLTLKLIEDC